MHAQTIHTCVYKIRKPTIVTIAATNYGDLINLNWVGLLKGPGTGATQKHACEARLQCINEPYRNVNMVFCETIAVLESLKLKNRLVN